MKERKNENTGPSQEKVVENRFTTVEQTLVGGRVEDTIPSPYQEERLSSVGLEKNIISNATAIKEHFRLGINHLVKLTIVVEGQLLRNYKSFELIQSTKTHHEFKLELSHDALGMEETYRMNHSKDLLGKRLLVTINFKNIKEKPERYFIGVITDVSFEQAHGSRGYIVLTGYSPTILLDGAPNLQSFGGDGPMPLSSVVHQMLKEGYSHNGKYSYSVQSSKKFNLSYTAQYNETHYNYLARMAEAYGEQFFYDGEILHFGDLPHGEKPIQLVYGRDVENIKIHQRARHINRLLYGYNSLKNERLNAGGNTKLHVKGTLAKAAYEKSERLYTAPSLQQAPIKAATNQDIEAAQRGVVGSNALQVFVTTGTTSIPFLYPGCVVELDMLEAGTKEASHFTRLMITDVTLNYAGILTASLSSAYPEAALRLNTSMYFAQARNSLGKNFKNVVNDGAKGIGWGIVGSGIDAASDHYENKMYNSNLQYLTEKLMIKNNESKGISVISKKRGKMRIVGYIFGVVIGAPLLFFIISKVFLSPREVTEEQVKSYMENSDKVLIIEPIPILTEFRGSDKRLGGHLLTRNLTFTNKGNSYMRAETYVYFCTELNKYVTTLVISEGGYVSDIILDFGKEGKDRNKYPNMYFYYNKTQYADPMMGTIDNPLPVLHMVSADPAKRSMRKDNKDSDSVYLQKVYHDNVQLYLSYFIEDKDYERLYPEK